MKQRLFNVFVRNVFISGLLVLIIANANALHVVFSGIIADERKVRLGLAVLLLCVIIVGALYLFMTTMKKNIKVELTSEPAQMMYLGWPLHTSLLSALLTIIILLYVTFGPLQPSNQLFYLLVFIGVYGVLAISSWVWIRYISKKEYTPKLAVSDDNLIRSLETYRMIDACICRKGLKGYIPLTRFSMYGVWLEALFILPGSLIVFEDIRTGRPSVGSLFAFVVFFYLAQILVRYVRYGMQGHSFRCAMRRAYCESF